MEQAKRNLRAISICVLALAAFSVIRLGVSLFMGGFGAISGIDQIIALVIKVIVVGATFLTLIPEVYIGVRGLQNAKNPTKMKAPIVWAIILLIVSAVGLVNPIVSFFTQGFVFENASTVGTLCCEIAVYSAYIAVAKSVVDSKS